mgnify:FL=1
MMVYTYIYKLDSYKIKDSVQAYYVKELDMNIM